MRVFPAVVVSLLINLLLFLLMHNMVSGVGRPRVEGGGFQGIEFIRFNRRPELPEARKRAVAEKPPPKKSPPPRPNKRMQVRPRAKPRPRPIRPPMRPISAPRRLIGGPYLGDFIPDPPPVTDPIPDAIETDTPPITDAGPDAIETVTSLNVDVSPGIVETDVIPLVRIPPRYPRRAVRSKTEGIVTIEFTITRDGSVVDPLVVWSAPPKVFDYAALQAIRRWKFRPKLVEGKPVQRRAVQNIRFSLKSD